MKIIIDSVTYDIREKEDIDFNEKSFEIDIEQSNPSFIRFLLNYRFRRLPVIDYIYCIDSNTSLYGCYFCINNKIASLKFDSAVIGLNCPIFDTQKTTSVFAKIDYTSYNMGDFEELSKSFNSFNIGKYHYSLSINYTPRFCVLSINFSGIANVSTMTKEFYTYFEFICFVCGCIFKLSKLYYTIDGENVCRLLNLNSKFDTLKKNLHYNKIIVDHPDFKKSYLTWKYIRNNTHLIFDLYYNSMNSFHFSEVSLALLLNCMEGYIKTLHMHEFINKSASLNLDHLLEKMYFSTSYSKRIMKKSERTKLNIFSVLNTHRNYFDHLDRVQTAFTGKKCDYILLKCELIFRIYILIDLGMSINITALDENIKKINTRIL